MLNNLHQGSHRLSLGPETEGNWKALGKAPAGESGNSASRPNSTITSHFLNISSTRAHVAAKPSHIITPIGHGR